MCWLLDILNAHPHKILGETGFCADLKKKKSFFFARSLFGCFSEKPHAKYTLKISVQFASQYEQWHL